MSDRSDNRSNAGRFDPRREPPPPELVEAAEHDYHLMRGRLTEATRSVRAQLDLGFTDFQAVADVWHSLRVQADRPATLLLAAVAIAQLAKVPDPPVLRNPRHGDE